MYETVISFLKGNKVAYQEQIQAKAVVVMIDKAMADDMIAVDRRPLPKVNLVPPATFFKAQARGYRP